MHCAKWLPAPDVAAEFSHLLIRLGAEETMHRWADNYVHAHAGRLVWDVTYLSQRPFRTCLNIGGVPYLFEYLLRKSRPEVHVTSLDLEPSRFPCAAKALQISVVEMDIERPDQEKLDLLGKFECIVLSEIFEHFRIDLIKTMRTVNRLLAPTGILYLTMPNGLGFSAWQRLIKGRTGPSPVAEWRKLSEIGHMGHVREYSLAEASEMLEFCGFRIEESFFRHPLFDYGTTRSKIRCGIQSIGTTVIPTMGDEIGIVCCQSA